MNVRDFLSRLERVKKQTGDNSWRASCPSHGAGGGDKNPSLSVKEADGKILLNCFAGCSASQVVAALGLEEKDLFAEKDAEPKRVIEREYNYHDEDGQLLFQAIRFSPKGFSQRRPDGKGGWLWNLQGIRRVVYRLPELLGQKAILWVEGEKDADRAWALGIPATCNAMGAGKWIPEYAQQLQKQGVVRVGVIPDNDPPGAAHAVTVAAGLQAVGIEVRIVPLPGVPEHGDLSDYLSSGHTKDDVLALVKAVKVADHLEPPRQKDRPEREFKIIGEQRYALEIHTHGIQIEVNRLRRTSHELVGELVVRVNGHFPDARTFNDGILQAGDLNFSSVQARSTRAKLLAERAGDKSADWFGYLEEFVTTVIATERKGKPAEILADVEAEEEAADLWLIDGFPLLQQLPQVLFGDSASGKSYFAMWLAGKLADDGIPVLYADWEFSKTEHKRRLQRLFAPMPKNLYYLRCDHALKYEVENLIDTIAKYGCKYIVADSIGFAVDGPAESQEGASAYFRYLRQLKVGSLSIAHIPKQYDDGREAQVFGSVFFRHGARSIWFIERAKDNPEGELRFGLYHRKNNTGALLKPKGFKLVFRGDRTRLEKVDLDTVDELAVNLPLVEQVRRALKDGPLTIKQIAEDLATTANIVRATIGKHKSSFIRTGQRVALAGTPVDNVQDNTEPQEGVEF